MVITKCSPSQPLSLKGDKYLRVFSRSLVEILQTRATFFFYNFLQFSDGFNQHEAVIRNLFENASHLEATQPKSDD